MKLMSQDEVRHLTKGTKGAVLNEGKTKIIFSLAGNEKHCQIESKDDITAGDGAKHDIIPNKAVLATTTTCNVFSLLKAAGVPVAYVGRMNECSFVAPICDMIKLEVIIRREAHGSFLKRYPHMQKGQLFPKLRFELFLKTSGKKWGSSSLLSDDPYIVCDDGKTLRLYDPAKPFDYKNLFHFIPATEVLADFAGDVKKIEAMARRTFLVLERQWQLLGRRLVDFKIEFGRTIEGQLVVADVIDNDSWRLTEDGKYIDKQVYRDGGALSEVAEKYAQVASLTERFGLPNQRLILWTGSKDDDTSPLTKKLESVFGQKTETNPPRPGDITWLHGESVVCSMHKEAGRGLRRLRELEQECPDSVVVAYIGRSNGAGPTLQAHTTMQVINCSPSVKEFENDIWSSLRMPSDVPCVTVMDPGNAVHAALNQLSRNNPALYALMRMSLEDRFENTMLL